MDKTVKGNSIKVSIITVSLNSEKTIRDTIESILGQTYSNVEYIIKDGGSKDETVKIAKEYITKFKEKGYSYKIISNRDSGMYNAMNHGIDISSGNIIGIINSDDWYESNTVELVVSHYNTAPFDIYMGAINIWKNGRLLKIKIPKKRMIKTSRDFCHPAMFVTRDAYLLLGKYNESNLFGDFDFWLRSLKAEIDFSITDKVLANFRIGGVSTQKSINKLKISLVDRYKTYKMNGYSSFYFVECIVMEVIKYFLS